MNRFQELDGIMKELTETRKRVSALEKKMFSLLVGVFPYRKKQKISARSRIRFAILSSRGQPLTIQDLAKQVPDVPLTSLRAMAYSIAKEQKGVSVDKGQFASSP